MFFNYLTLKKEKYIMKKKTIPKFKNEDEERKFWGKNDSTEYIDWKKAEKATFPNLKPTMKTISLRLPEALLNRLRVLANEKDVPYQSLKKICLKEKIDHKLKIRI
jgi:predicted DNA binding CopG/RHH family protein